MSLAQHLSELRKRLMLAAAGVLLGAIAGWFLSGVVMNALRTPVTDIAVQQHRLAQLNFDGSRIRRTSAPEIRPGGSVSCASSLAYSLARAPFSAGAGLSYRWRAARTVSMLASTYVIRSSSFADTSFPDGVSVYSTQSGKTVR